MFFPLIDSSIESHNQIACHLSATRELPLAARISESLARSARSRVASRSPRRGLRRIMNSPHGFPRQAESRTTRSRAPSRRAAADPRGRGLGQNARHHVPHRLPHRRRARRTRTRCSRSRSPTRRRRKCASASRRSSATTASGVWLSTFHSLCARLLRREAPKIGLSRDFVIYDSSDQVAVVKQAQRELGIDDKLVPPRMALSRISQAKNRMEGPDTPARRLEHPRRADREDLRALPAGAHRRERARLRRPAAENRRALRDLAAGARVLRAQVQVRDGGRVPGHEPSAIPAHPAARGGRIATSPSSAIRTSRSTSGAAPTCATSSTSSRTSARPKSSGSSRTTARRR